MPETVIDRASARALDAEAIGAWGVPGIVLMENAARNASAVADLMLRSTARDGRSRRALVVCGPGNNGGDGWAMARHLDRLGHRVTIAALAEPRDGTDAAINRTIVARMSLPTRIGGAPPDASTADLVVDALFGTGLERALEGDAARWVEAFAGFDAPILAVDVPSGLDADTGRAPGPVVRAERTVTFVAAKPGFSTDEGRAATGIVHVVDIGAPRALVERHVRTR